MEAIHKYEVKHLDRFEIEMPKGAEILTVQTQHEAPVLWALVDPDGELEKRTFALHGTGHPVRHASRKKYIGTYQLNIGFVGHLFEEVE